MIDLVKLNVLVEDSRIYPKRSVIYLRFKGKEMKWAIYADNWVMETHFFETFKELYNSKCFQDLHSEIEDLQSILMFNLLKSCYIDENPYSLSDRQVFQNRCKEIIDIVKAQKQMELNKKIDRINELKSQLEVNVEALLNGETFSNAHMDKAIHSPEQHAQSDLRDLSKFQEQCSLDQAPDSMLSCLD